MSADPAWEHERSTWPHHEISRFVEAGGLRWHVQQCGSGPPLLLVHGTGASTHSWRKLMPLLAARFSVLALDLPGHGFSSSPQAAQRTIGGMSGAVAALLRELRIEPQYCVGHSAGAVILCRMALDDRIAPRAIISINGAFLPLSGVAGIFFSPIARLLASNSLLPRVLARGARSPESVARVIAGTGSRLDAEGLALYGRLVGNPKHMAGALGMMGSWDLRAFERDLPRLTTPLALLVADNDLTVPPRQATSVQRRVVHAEVHRLPGLGHLAHEEQPQWVAEEILKICRAHPAPPTES